MEPPGGLSSTNFDRTLRAHVNRHISNISNNDRIDEGFSEAVNDESASDTPCAPEPIEVDEPEDVVAQAVSVRNWLLTQPLELRCELARVLLASLPTPALSTLVKEADVRLHFDPATYFPPEIYFHILKYLPPIHLIRASHVSKAWRARAMDVTLWRRLFALEGWTSNPRVVRMLESTAQTQSRKFWASAGLSGLQQQGLQSQPGHEGQTFQSRLWIRNGIFQIPASITNATADHYNLQSVRRRAFEYMQDPDSAEDVTMFDSAPGNVGPFPSGRLSDVFCPLLDPPRLVDAVQQLPQPNWHYLFTQRQRLEQNWSNSLFKNFRLPKEEYDHEKHRECIYTLQFSSKHVVSGSRDKTIRVWDLESQRLKLPPLCGHKASVLCLQFDESPEMDVIVSGGSDAAIIFWKFSTGTQMKQIKKAHTMAVLNLRFDKRYLVTCSKDNTIKLWSMKDLTTSSPDYPPTNKSMDAIYPDYIVDVNALAAELGPRSPLPLPKFTLLMTFVGHSAAVNALQLLGDEIVSASGDRKIMLWHIPSGTLRRTFSGHAKGIACVQYDGRRIISGSSDESVRIFDVETTAEISLLNGHRDLVRTIQADFGDVPGDELRQEAEARAHSRQMLDNKRRRLFGELAPSPKEEQFVIGAKLPPGGGGNRWSKIVSGSYDETVIIWRQDKNGRWMITKELRQEDAMRATTSSRPPANIPRVPLLPPSSARRLSTTTNPTTALQQAHTGLPSTTSTQPSSSFETRAMDRQTAMQMAQGWLGTRRLSNGQWVQPQIPGNILDASTDESADVSEASASAAADTTSASLPSSSRLSLAALRFQAAVRTQDNPSTSAIAPPATSEEPPTTSRAHLPPPPTAPLHLPAHQHLNHPHFNHQMHPHPQPNTQAHAPPHTNANTQAHAPPHPPQPPQPPQQGAEMNTSRLFKLQFDSRRIICCSQQPIIVGWDFANGDKDIIEASQFFGETS